MRRVITLFVLFLTLGLARSANAQDIITTVAGGGPNNLPAVSANLDEPLGVAFDAAGNLFIADEGSHRIFKVDTSGQLTVVAGIGIFGFSGDGGPATSASLASPVSVALDGAGNLFITDQGNQRIRRVDAATGIITTVAGNGFGGFSGDGGPATSASLTNPFDVALDGAGNLFIADFSNSRIRKVDTSGIITTVAGNGGFTFSGDGGPATSASLRSPTGVALDGAGNLFIADGGNFRIRKVDTSGIITTVAGNGSSEFSGDGGPATSASLTNPFGVALDGTGNLFIADEGSNRIRKVDTSGIITTVAGNGSSGFSGDGGPAISASLSGPIGVALDGTGNLFFADAGNNRIRKVDTSGIISTVAGDGIFGFSGDGDPATSASLRDPFGVALDGAGNLFIADRFNQRIRRVDAATGIITTVAGDGPTGIGAGGFSGDGGPATSASLWRGLDGSGNLFIADTLNNRIRKVDTSGIITTVAGNGSFGFSGDGGPATSASLSFPFGVALDGSGNLFIADFSNSRIRKVSFLNPPAVSLSIADLTFADRPVGTTSTAQTVTLTNNGEGVFTISSIAVSGDFAQTNDCASLAASASCTFNVTFTPTAGGARTGILTIDSNDPSSPQIVALSGTGIAPAVSLTSTSLTFVAQLVGTTGDSQIVTLTNTGSASLNFSSIVASGDFAQTNDCGTSVAAAASCTITVSFTPTGDGIRTGELILSSNDPNSPQSILLTGEGIGVVSDLTLSASSLTFGDQLCTTTSSAQNVTLTNTGDAVINISSIFASGEFTVTNDCGASVAAAASCTITVSFTPKVIGARTGSVTIVTDAPGSPHGIELSGTAVELSLMVTAASQLEKTIEAGETATFQMTLVADGVTEMCFLSCSGAPAGATCTVEPAEMGLGGPVTTTVVASVRTTARTSGAATFPGPTGRNPWQPWFFVFVVVVSMVEAMRRRGSIIPTLRLKRAYVGLGAILLMVGLWTACGTGGMENAGGGTGGTPPGTSTLTVTVRTSSGQSMSAAVTLNVR